MTSNIGLILATFQFLSKKGKEKEWFKTIDDYNKVKESPDKYISCNIRPGVFTSFGYLSEFTGLENPATEISFTLEIARKIISEVEALLPYLKLVHESDHL